jgi:hypothetical protein
MSIGSVLPPLSERREKRFAEGTCLSGTLLAPLNERRLNVTQLAGHH